MSLLESFIYSFLVFLGLYAVIAVALRVFDLTNAFYAHVFAGIVGTVFGVVAFILFLLKK